MRSYTHFYWAAWLCAVLIFISCSLASSLTLTLGWFALFAGILGSYVFHFEFGRLMGFLKNHFPERYAAFPHSAVFEIFAFFHPAMLRACWLENTSSLGGYSNAIAVYRSAWLFSFVSLFSLLPLAWFLS